MSIFLESHRISLLSDCEPAEELWQLFRRTAVEPGQASSPTFASFVDECLLCANITVKDLNRRTGDEMEDDDSLWDAHFPAGRPSPPSARPPPSHDLINRNVGLVYLHAGPANLPAGEANIGVIVSYGMRRRGYAREAAQLVLRWAFEELKFHRVQVAILDTPFKDRALRLFIGLGFAHEGTKRRAVYQPEGEGMAGIWKDVTYLGMLDTEWTLRSTWKGHNIASTYPAFTAWDEMFARHSREREELLRWEEDHGRIKRSSSTETLRVNVGNTSQDITYLTDDASSIGEPSVSGSAPASPRPNVFVTWEDNARPVDMYDPDEFDQSWEEVVEMTLATQRERQGARSSLLGSSLRPLPSIPSTRVSEGIPQSPLTIPTSSTPGSTPPPSPSSLAPSSVYSSWPDSEDEDNWLPRDVPPPTDIPSQITVPHDPCPRVGQTSRSRSSSWSSSSTGSWSDAQSSVGTSSSNWDVISSTSARSHGARIQL